MSGLRDPRCGGGCTLPVIDFVSGQDDIYVCGEVEHYSSTCLLLSQRPTADSIATEQLTGRRRLAQHVGQAGWRLGYTVSQVGRHLERLGDRVIDGGDWLAGKVAGR